jgi:transposase
MKLNFCAACGKTDCDLHHHHLVARATLLDGRSVRQAAKATGASVGTIAAVREELVADGSL